MSLTRIATGDDAIIECMIIECIKEWEWKFDGDGVYNVAVGPGTVVQHAVDGYDCSVATRLEYRAIVRKMPDPSLGFEVFVSRIGSVFHISEASSFQDAAIDVGMAIWLSERVHRFTSYPKSVVIPESRAKNLITEFEETVRDYATTKALMEEGAVRVTDKTLLELEKDVKDARVRVLNAILGVEP